MRNALATLMEVTSIKTTAAATLAGTTVEAIEKDMQRALDRSGYEALGKLAEVLLKRWESKSYLDDEGLMLRLGDARCDIGTDKRFGLGRFA